MSTRDSDEESEYFSEDGDTTRSNLWTGHINTWKSMTREERGYNASLTQLRNQDLSIHLYNAHTLKRRARELRTGVHKEFEDPENFGSKQDFEPPKSWTAWPLPPDEVPRDGETVGPDDPLELFTLKRREIERPSRELEEILMGTILKYAKRRFESREPAEKEEEENTDFSEVMGDIGIGSIGQAESDEDMTSGSPDSDVLVQAKDQPEQSTSSSYLKPVISADDERSREILRPSIRHTLSKLDEILMALHHARDACQFYASQSEPGTEDESRAPSECQTEGPPVVKRPKGRPRKHAPLTSRPKPKQTKNKELDAEYARLLPPKKSRVGRPMNPIEQLEGETEEEYLVRVARIRKQPLPTFAPPIIKEYLVKAKTPQPRIRRASSEDLAKRRKRILGLRDWSEVLGSAALVGFSPDVIARATQRCATLFGESMTTESLSEGPAIAKNLEITHYHPEVIPDLEDAPKSNASSNYDTDSESNKEQSRQPNHKPKELPSIEDPYSCPFSKCKNRQFSTTAKRNRHLKMVHEVKQNQIDEMTPAVNEMDGAVHVDGFLRPLQNPLGGRGRDENQRKRPRKTDTGKNGSEGSITESE